MKTALKYGGYYGQQGGAFTPASLGSKLKAWSEVDGLVNGSTTAQGQVTAGDLVQWNDLSGNGNHWTISTGAPAYDGTKLVFTKGNSDGLINTGLFTDCGTDTQGEIIVVAEKITGESIFPFTASRAADTLKRCLTGITDTDDKLFLQIKIDNSNLANWTSPLFTNAGKFIAAYRSTGTAYGIYAAKSGSEAEQSLTEIETGTLPDGHWFGDVTPGNFGCMKLIDSSPVYYTGNVYAIFYCNEPLSVSERTNLFDYLQDKYSI